MKKTERRCVMGKVLILLIIFLILMSQNNPSIKSDNSALIGNYMLDVIENKTNKDVCFAFYAVDSNTEEADVPVVKEELKKIVVEPKSEVVLKKVEATKPVQSKRKDLVNEVIEKYNGRDSYDHRVLNEIANALRGKSKNETIMNIYRYAFYTFDGNFKFKGTSVLTAMRTKQGDCTEVSLLSDYLLKRNDIDSRLVHGYIKTDSELIKHDWVEFYDSGEWINLDKFYWGVENELIREGFGVW